MISPAVAAARLAARHGHFFPAGLLNSQFGELQPPGPDEPVLVVDAGLPRAELVDEIIGRLQLA